MFMDFQGVQNSIDFVAVLNFTYIVFNYTIRHENINTQNHLSFLNHKNLNP